MIQTLEELKADWNPTIDLGGSHFFSFTQWSPDRSLNPQYDGIPDVEKWGGIHIHPRPDGNGFCLGSIAFQGEVQDKVAPDLQSGRSNAGNR